MPPFQSATCSFHFPFHNFLFSLPFPPFSLFSIVYAFSNRNSPQIPAFSFPPSVWTKITYRNSDNLPRRTSDTTTVVASETNEHNLGEKIDERGGNENRAEEKGEGEIDDGGATAS